jgi:isocitrate/isopropylmalate dehydrogenase
MVRRCCSGVRPDQLRPIFNPSLVAVTMPERLMKAMEHVTADPSLHTPDLGGKATTKQVTDAVCEALWQAND